MANRFSRNNDIAKHAKYYYKIINEEFYGDDKISSKIVNIYREYIFSVKMLNEKTIGKIKKIDIIINKYFDDLEFKKELSSKIVSIRVKQTEDNILECIVDEILSIYDKYLESYTRNIYIPKWI